MSFFCVFFLAVIVNCFAYELKELPRVGNTGSKVRLTLVFLPRHYSKPSDFETDVTILLNGLKKAKPFSEFPDAIAAWKMDVPPAEAREFLKERKGFPPIKVEVPFLQSVNDKLKTNYKLIILDKTGWNLCAELSSPEATSPVFLGRLQFSKDAVFVQGFLHELGHSLGLHDESLFSIQPIAPGPPNCAPDQKTAEAWWGDMVARKVRGVSYYPLRSGQNHFLKPTFHSIMEDPYRFNDFGPVNERYLRQVLESYQES